MLSATGCRIGYDYQYDGLRRRKSAEFPVPDLLRKLIGEEYFVDVASLSFQGNADICNEDLDPIRRLKNVHRLDLDYTNVDTITAIQGLGQLRWLDLEETRINEHGDE